MAASFQFSLKVHRRADPPPKKATSRDFGHFYNLDAFWKREPRGIQTPSGTSQIAVVLEIWLPEVLISLENMREGRTKNRDFLKFRFSDPFESPKWPTKGAPYLGSFDRALSFFGVYQRP